MSINCLCLINDPPLKNSSYIKITRLRMEQENNMLPRHDEIKIYLPNITGIAKVSFVHELSNKEQEQVYEQEIYGKNSKYKIIEYYGMNSESENHESRAVIDNNTWTVWNDHTKTFSKKLDFSGGSYFIVKFPQSYWEQLGQNTQ